MAYTDSMFLFVYFERLLQCRLVTDLFIVVEVCVCVSVVEIFYPAIMCTLCKLL